MRLSRSLRWLLLLAMLVPLVPARAHAGVFISVGFAPPPLVEYAQPVCPEPGWMWTPGYWAYGPDGYYWVPGVWVPAPAVGMLWTPGYWGYENALYVWHPGYWGPHVGYYGGVDYGFGYMGIGFVGGMWRGNVFAYNTAVMHVGSGDGWANRVYVDRTIVERNTIVNNRHVAYAGGPGGINHPPTAQERSYMNERHMGATSVQTAHLQAAQQNRNAYFNANHGHPQEAAMARPMASPAERPNNVRRPSQPQQQRQTEQRPQEQMRPETRPEQQSRPEARPQERPQSRPEQQPRPEARPQERPQSRPEQQPRPEARPQERPQSRPESRPQERPQSRPEERSQPHDDSHDKGRP